jgi:hypothetical protein
MVDKVRKEGHLTQGDEQIQQYKKPFTAAHTVLPDILDQNIFTARVMLPWQ